MLTRFVEVTDGIAYGKFIVARMSSEELATASEMPGASGARLLRHAGRRRFDEHTTLVVDLQRGTGFAWPLENGFIGMGHYERGKLKGIARLVCPLYLAFVLWLHLDGRWAEGQGDIEEIPRYIDLRTDAQEDFYRDLARLPWP